MDDNKVLSALDKIADFIFYEEGRLAIINKYGTILDDNDTAKATELITKQTANLDQLFTVYKNVLKPIIATISSVGNEIDLLISKLSVSKIAENSVDLQPKEESVQLEVPAGQTEVDNNTIEAEQTVATDSSIVGDSGASAVSEPISAESGVATGSEVVELPNVVEQPAVENNIATEVNGVMEEQGANAVVNDATTIEKNAPISDALTAGNQGEKVVSAASEALDFVLSPIDEDVAPVPTIDDNKIADGVAGAEQQLQAVENFKQEISDNPNLTSEEKAEQLERYTRLTNSAVRAILVTKVQYEKLFASKDKQKALRGENQNNAEVITDNNNAQVIVPPIVLDTEQGQTSSNMQDKQKEMQNMIEQANTLYKEGKTQEAQEMFDKVGAMNKEIQSAVSSPVNDNANAAVLVKK